MTDMLMIITDEEKERLHTQMMANLAAQGEVPAWIDEAEAALVAQGVGETISRELADVTRRLVGRFRAAGWDTSPGVLVKAVVEDLRGAAYRMERAGIDCGLLREQGSN